MTEHPVRPDGTGDDLPDLLADLVPAEQDVRARVGELDLDDSALAAVSNVYRVANAVRSHMEQTVLREDDLSWTSFQVLWVLWIWGDLETRQVAAECGIAKGTLTGVVARLEDRELVARTPHPTDGRLVMVGLTDAGRALITRLFPRFNAQEAAVTRRLSDAQRRELAHLLREVLRSVDDL